MDIDKKHKYDKIVSYLEKLLSIIHSNMNIEEVIYYATELWRRNQTSSSDV